MTIKKIVFSFCLTILACCPAIKSDAAIGKDYDGDARIEATPAGIILTCYTANQWCCTVFPTLGLIHVGNEWWTSSSISDDGDEEDTGYSMQAYNLQIAEPCTECE